MTNTNEKMVEVLKLIKHELKAQDKLPKSVVAYNIVGVLIQLESFDELEEYNDNFYNFFNAANGLEIGRDLPANEQNEIWDLMIKDLALLEKEYKK